MDSKKHACSFSLKYQSKSTTFKSRQNLAKKKLQIEIKGLVILGMSFLVDPLTLGGASCLRI
jgi:hypothetical protein